MSGGITAISYSVTSGHFLCCEQIVPIYGEVGTPPICLNLLGLVPDFGFSVSKSFILLFRKCLISNLIMIDLGR